MDTAKAVAVEAAHPGTAWDYLHYTAGPTEKTLPIIAVGMTAEVSNGAYFIFTPL